MLRLTADTVIVVFFCAECLARISPNKPLLISAVGGDVLGEMLLRQLEFVRVVSHFWDFANDTTGSDYNFSNFFMGRFHMTSVIKILQAKL